MSNQQKTKQEVINQLFAEIFVFLLTHHFLGLGKAEAVKEAERLCDRLRRLDESI